MALRTKAKATAVIRAMQGDPFCEAGLAGRGHYLCCNRARWVAIVTRHKQLVSQKLCTMHCNRFLAAGLISWRETGSVKQL